MSEAPSATAACVLGMVNRIAAGRAGLSKRSARVRGYDVHYYEGGRGEPVVLLHGLGDDKNSFLRAARWLSRGYRVLLPDLQGHGENARDPERDYTIRGHVESLHAFAEALGLEAFHLGGNSMGGHTSLAYAIRHPELVRGLMLINAPGLFLDDTVVYTGFGAPLETMEDVHRLLDRVYHVRPKLPGFMLRYLRAETNRTLEMTNRMARAVREGPDHRLNERLGEVRAPTLVLWGRHDVCVKLGVAEGYRDRIADARLVVVDDAGHSPQLEVPDRIGQELRRFLDSIA